MDIKFSCDKCGQHLSIDETGAGQAVQCPACGQSLTVPDAVPAPPEIVQQAPPVTQKSGAPPVAGIVKCKTCGKEVSKNAPTCPHCGESTPGLHIKCPNCNSMRLSTGQKGFGLGKAGAGLILLGPIGLLGGMIGRKKAEWVCDACGHKWNPEPEVVKFVCKDCNTPIVDQQEFCQCGRKLDWG